MPQTSSQSETISDSPQATVWGAFLTVLGYLRNLLSKPARLSLSFPRSFRALFWIMPLIIALISFIMKGVAPLCLIPGAGRYGICMAPPQELKPNFDFPQWADFPSLITAQTRTFEQILDDAAGGSVISLKLKKAEMAMSDIVILVKLSELASRDLLAETIVDFVKDARKAGHGLQLLGSKISGAVDQITSVNEYALATIDAARARSLSSSMNAISPFYFSPAGAEVVVRTFADVMGSLSSVIGQLIVEAEIQLANLDKLEERLLVVHEIILREDSLMSLAKSELLAELWTRLGWRQRSLDRYDSHLKLLSELGGYRQQALAHVISALHTLRALSGDMEIIRERVAEPQLAGAHIPFEAHIHSIQLGLARLRALRIDARGREL
ncbi:hypothetical protein BT96DRAFT_1003935 [Gymnopus androsaceus JB14]|uniref:Uncharacterized protein n=1 Tax=Gymnopus androsaceus JB14 TaxID=1447944 RepID=A0A6A4GSF7_9AGAR|nr:hypothetical protein BT96DRAFT_1003935 [Gymnopus androsaceus JB14]